ncbi:MAG: hypothetical protein M3328_02725 [Chloroflexota bacterium]|nr:hypothetical protein [Chloroflexota bacterium]
MPELSTLVLFVGAAVVLLVVPGPAVLYIVAPSIDQGRLAGGVGAGDTGGHDISAAIGTLPRALDFG